MAIGRDDIELLIRLRISGLIPRHCAVMEIGAQQLASTVLKVTDRVARLGQLFGIDRAPPLGAPRPIQIAHGRLEHLDADAPMARDFWLWLGFDYAAIDIDGSPGSISLDLNYDDAPTEAIGRYDLVTNFGTTEHVANQLNAFKVIHELTVLDGIMVHHLPAQGMFNHGLINYNFKLFWMLARSNGYKFVDAQFLGADIRYPLPKDIVDFLGLNRSTAAESAHDFNGADAGIQVALQKCFDIPFVPPIDVPTGARTDIESLKRRYWTVFEPDVFETLRAGANHTNGSRRRVP